MEASWRNCVLKSSSFLLSIMYPTGGNVSTVNPLAHESSFEQSDKVFSAATFISMNIQMKSIEQYFHVVLCIMLDKIVVNFESG